MKRIFFLSMMIFFMATLPMPCSFGADVVRPEIFLRPEFNKVRFFYSTGRIDDGKAELRKIANQYIGTDIGATALLEMTEIQSGTEEIQTLDEIINRYPGTGYWLSAKLRKISQKYNPEQMAQGLTEQNPVIKELGGPDIFDFLSGKGNNFDSSGIPIQYRDHLANYLFGEGLMYNDKNSEKQIMCLVFIRDKFPRFNWENVPSEIRDEVLRLRKGKMSTVGFPGDNTPPIIRPIAPHDGLQIGETRPKIEIELEDGDISQTQVNLSKLIFTLDGQDLTDVMKVKSTINTSGQLGPTFEKLQLTYRPATPLSIGLHTVYVKAIDYGGHASEKTWRFYVKR
jgi:hypothetical protein